jgi:DNA-binding transcriptional MerR regulator
MYDSTTRNYSLAIGRNGINQVNKTYSIRELASEFGITTRTIRFYEEKGYLNPKREGTRRIYSAPDRTSLRLILRGKRLGLSLDETADLIKMYGSPRNNRKQLEKFILRIGEKRAELEHKRRDLEVMLSDLKSVEDKCQLSLAEHG